MKAVGGGMLVMLLAWAELGDPPSVAAATSDGNSHEVETNLSESTHERQALQGDTTPPRVVSAAGVELTLLGLCFSERLDPALAVDASHYKVSGADVAGVKLQADGKSVQLALDEPVSNPVIVLNGLADLAGNLIAPDTMVQVVRWADALDVGQATPAGTQFTCREGEVAVVAGGADIWGTFDQFRFVYQPVQNDFDVKVKVTRLDPVNPWSKAGLMVRETLSGASPSLHLVTTPVEGDGAGLLEAGRRLSLDRETLAWGTRPTSRLPDQWLRLQRLGDLFTGWHSEDGKDWRQFAVATQALNSSVLVGLAATSHDPGATTTAQFESFEFLSTGSLIARHPESQEVRINDTVILSVEASGPSPFSYQWRLNGKNIRGANESTLLLPDVQPEDGGTYTVVVISELGIETSLPAEVIVDTPFLPFSDDFDRADILFDATGCGQGFSGQATREEGEPTLAGQPGGRSVWISWRALHTGIATFSTAGSGFDTLLGVFQGESVEQLTPVAVNDDAGSLYSSRVTFNAVEGEIYRVVLDGVGGVGGPLQLCWSLEKLGVFAPIILSSPISQSAEEGASVLLAAEVVNATTFQWYRNGRPLEGENRQRLFIPALSREDVGTYVLEAIMGAPELERSIRVYSLPAIVEIGPVSSVVSQDKLESFLLAPPPRLRMLTASSTASAGTLTVGAGSLGSQILNNSEGGTSLSETNHCGVLGNASRWLVLTTSTNEMTFQVDTEGSAVATILAVYQSESLIGTRTLVGCSANGSADNEVTFPGEAGLYYWIAVDGLDGAEGVIQLNWRLGTLPVFTAQPEDQVVRPGGTARFAATALGVPAPAHAWSTNGMLVSAATADWLELSGVETPLLVTASVSNFMGTATSDPAQLYIAQVMDLEWSRSGDGRSVVVEIPAALATNAFIIQASSNLVDWIGVQTNQAPNLRTDFIDPDAGLYPHRFYRVLETVP